ncbi:hypothetical protein MAR_035716 [Mya arenaria]|uniref:EF-hand domain-containing protein n=1 Tax=Mya arenaria TaxID=6604 RepID=A0ABY7EKY1_MYAAR|nr:hypothetical protein MAR_035716 [Mya arenaria]
MVPTPQQSKICCLPTPKQDDFMLYVVRSLCKDTGGWLADWVLKHVDTDGDGRIGYPLEP